LIKERNSIETDKTEKDTPETESDFFTIEKDGVKKTF